MVRPIRHHRDDFRNVFRVDWPIADIPTLREFGPFRDILERNWFSRPRVFRNVAKLASDLIIDQTEQLPTSFTVDPYDGDMPLDVQRQTLPSIVDRNDIGFSRTSVLCGVFRHDSKTLFRSIVRQFETSIVARLG